MTDTLRADTGSVAFVDDVVARVRRRYWKLEHPLAERLLAGDLDTAALTLWASQYYILTVEVANCITYVIANAPDLAAKRKLVHNLEEEYGHPAGEGLPAHRELFVDFASSMGIPAARITDGPWLPGTRGLVAITRELTKRSFLAGIVTVPIVGELFGPESSTAYLHVFRDVYKAPDVRYWDIHISADEGHGETGRRLLESLGRTQQDRDEIDRVVEWALDAFWGFYDSILQYATSPTYDLATQ